MNTVEKSRQVVVVDPDVKSGAPVFAGTRVPVQTLFDYLEGGDDLAEFLEDFPSVPKPHALQVLEFLTKHGCSRRSAVCSPGE